MRIKCTIPVLTRKEYSVRFDGHILQLPNGGEELTSARFFLSPFCSSFRIAENPASVVDRRAFVFAGEIGRGANDLIRRAPDLSRILLPAFILCMNRFQISPEERVLASLFAHDYAEYRQGAAMALEDRELAPKQTGRNLWNT
jgi:hypothetical protein